MSRMPRRHGSDRAACRCRALSACAPPRANLRVGPGTDYAVQWTFVRSGVPLEIVQEYDNWRRVRDAEGAEGWINHSLLSGSRTAISCAVGEGPDPGTAAARPAGGDRPLSWPRLEPGLMGELRSCDGQWCEMDFFRRQGLDFADPHMGRLSRRGLRRLGPVQRAAFGRSPHNDVDIRHFHAFRRFRQVGHRHGPMIDVHDPVLTLDKGKW